MGFKLLKEEVDKGLAGRNGGIPIRRSMYYLIGGLTGSGKTSFIDDAFVLNPVDWALSKEGRESGIKIKVWYRSMERSQTYKLAKWTCRKIFQEQGVIIPVNKLLGWTSTMTKDEHDMFLMYEDYMNELMEIVTIIDGPENEITLVVLDHIGLLKTTSAQPTKKQAIDKMSDELRYARDFYGYSPVVVSQFNRSISNPIRIKNGDVEPQMEDFADSSTTQNDSDICMALFDPMRYKVEDPSGYDLNKLKDDFGSKYFRSLRVIKNSYGEDDIRIGLGFLGQIGMFKELPRRRDITEANYQTVVDKSFFLS